MKCLSGRFSFKTLVKFVVIFGLSLRKGDAQDFGYDGNLGPSHWGEKYSTCVGKHQSPIDISEKYISLVKLNPLLFENFDDVPEDASLTNNGHTVMYKITNERMPELSGGPLRGSYQFEQLHFHWGENDDEGSENTINNSSFPMELHIVFYKSEYGTFQEATKHSDGLTVLAFLYKIVNENNTFYDSILSALRQVENPNSTINVPKPNPLNDLLMIDRTKYFTYDGSLTTPPCTEVVIWIEFQKPIGLSHDQLEIFRNLNNEEGKMRHNFRPTQPLYDRIIYYNSDDETYDINDNNIDGNDLQVDAINNQRGISSRNNYCLAILFTMLSLLLLSLL